jgi:DNA-binding NtrC family response regulator
MLRQTNAPNDLKAVRVLLIESDPRDAQLLTACFANQEPGNLELISAPTLAEGLRILQSKSVDLVLLDLFLQDSSGLTTLTRVFDASPDCAVVVLADPNNQTIEINALKQCAQEYVIKGQLDSDNLLAVVHRALDRRKCNQQRIELEHAATSPRNDGDFSESTNISWNGFRDESEGCRPNPSQAARIVPGRW